MPVTLHGLHGGVYPVYRGRISTAHQGDKMTAYRETLAEIYGKTHELHELIHTAMDGYESNTPEWAELYIMARLTGALGDMAYHIGALGGQPGARTEPVTRPVHSAVTF
jgi:hypothetical protein